MKVAFCSLLIPDEKKIAEKIRGHLPGISVHKFANAIIKGLDANLDEPVKVFNIINTLNYPRYPVMIFKKEHWCHYAKSKDIHIGYINLFGIKYITQENNLYQELESWVKTLNGEKCMICVHHNYYPMMRASLRIKKKYPNLVKTCLISGDIPGKYGLKSQYKDNMKEKLIEKMNQKILLMAKKFDSFVFQTKYMSEGFGVQDKPVCVLECCYSAPEYRPSKKVDEYKRLDKKIVFYAGSLRKEYDAMHLINAFSLIKDAEYELWLAGGGNAVDEIISIAQKDKRIKYLGFISPQEVLDRQEAATILVSPRTSDHMFVKYSFPSKTMECLASGKPYIAHQLPCEPREYRLYIQYPSDESDEALSKKIVEICSLSLDRREEIGKKGKRFIEMEKNPEVMCKRVIEFWSSLLGSE